MEANCPQQVATPAAASPEPTEGLATAVLDRIGQLVCGLHGHDEVLQFEDSRIFLRCVTCGHESPGWQMPERTPVLKFAGAVGRPSGATQDAPAKRVA